MRSEFPGWLIEGLRGAQRVAALTGAGISAESGVPTYRGQPHSLWADFNPEELATPEAFRRDPKKVWEWYALRRELLQQVAPNPGHLALAAIGRHVPAMTVITQNIDGLHQEAGSADVIELHGSLRRTRCSADGRPVTGFEDQEEVPPHCPRCGALLRPDVVWFGELLPHAALQRAEQVAMKAEILFSIGTSSVVYPAAGMPLVAMDRGAKVVEINPEETGLSELADLSIRGKAGEVLPRLVAEVWPE